MRIVSLTATAGKGSYIARIGYGDFVYSFFSTVSYYFEGKGNWGKKFPKLLLDLCDHGLVKYENLDELGEELEIIYKELKKLSLSNAIYDLKDLNKPMPYDLLPNEKIENLSQLWITPRGRRVYLDTFKELISFAKYEKGSLVLMYASESLDDQIWIMPKNKGREYWLDMVTME